MGWQVCLILLSFYLNRLSCFLVNRLSMSSWLVHSLTVAIWDSVWDLFPLSKEFCVMNPSLMFWSITKKLWRLFFFRKDLDCLSLWLKLSHRLTLRSFDWWGLCTCGLWINLLIGCSSKVKAETSFLGLICFSRW